MTQVNNHRLLLKRTIQRFSVSIALIVLLGTAGWAQSSTASETGAGETPDVTYTFQTVIYPGDTFTQLLGVNNNKTIAGYHGNGNTGHPNKGFTLTLPSTFTAENFPASAQTQVIGINNADVTDGFYIDTHGVNHGFTKFQNNYTRVDFPGTTFNQLLGLNSEHQASGFYNDSSGNSHGYVYAENGGVFAVFTIPGATSAQATGINNTGEVCGFYVESGITHGFLLNFGTLVTLNYPSATSTMAFGLNNVGQVVGTYTDSGGLVHGFVYKAGTYQSVDDPSGIGATIINGINDNGVLVGFFGACATGGSTCDGFVATP